LHQHRAAPRLLQEALPDYVNVLDIAHKLAPPAALYAHLTGVWDHVMGGEFGVDSHVSEGDTSIATAALMFNLNPTAPPAGIVPLLISATGVHANAIYSVVRRSTLVSGTASFGELIITGSLFGGMTLTYSGTPPANYILCRSIDHTKRTSGNNGDLHSRPRMHRHRRNPGRGGACCSDEC